MMAFAALSPSCSSVAMSSNFSSSTKKHRPAVILPGLGNSSGDYNKFQGTLKEYGVATVVANVARVDWLRNAAGLLDSAYWRGTLQPRPVLDWYLKRIDDAVCEARELAEDGDLTLIGHSAGGWLARLYMEEFGKSDFRLLLTLGTPHLPPPKGVPGVIDQTRGLLNYIEKHCAKAVYGPQLKYVCIAGRYIKGARLVGKSEMDVSETTEDGRVAVAATKLGSASINLEDSEVGREASFRARFVGQGYKQVCGKAEVWGDGVVPEESAHLEGALNISLEGVYHSPVGSDDLLRPWYGSPNIVNQWIHHLVELE